MSVASNWSSFWLGAACAFAVSYVASPTPCKAACVEVSAAILNCSSTAPMPDHVDMTIVQVTGDQPTALQVQGGNDQAQRDNAAADRQAEAVRQYWRSVAELNNRIARRHANY